MEARLSVARNLLVGDYITVEGPDGWSDIAGKVIVQKVAPKINGQGDLIDVTITQQKPRTPLTLLGRVLLFSSEVHY